MNLNLKERCDQSREKEFFYGAKLNKEIKDVYIGLCYLEPKETNRKVGPGRGHEELLYLINGKIEISSNPEKETISEGEVYFMPNGKKVLLSNQTDDKVYFLMAGGHTKHHSH